MENFIIAAILLLIIGAAAIYVVRAKKRGVKCIGCPAGGECGHKKNGESGCTCGGSCGDNCNCHDDTK